ncbi:MAG TPA: Gfo/Idh/MocA family oxidoreductase [Puia sp.]|jgi:predicted dehydrogenase|nr:Gfo/Idh/MocA family oxidoreductase [Puia sp.]
MKEYNWGIIGPGKIAAKFAAALPLAGNATLKAVASRDLSRARNFADTSGAAQTYDSYEKLAADSTIDAVYVATPHGFHAEHSILCLRRGKAVLCEKPMALNAAQVSGMIAESRSNNAFLMEAMWTRFLPLIQQITDLIATGKIGEVKYIRADFGFLSPFQPSSRLYDLRLGGGSLLDIGVYPLFLCLHLLGEPDNIRAAGHLAPTGADETCHAVLTYKNGRSAVITSTLACQTSLTAEIAGTQGSIRIPTPWYKNDRLTWSRTGQPEDAILLDPVVNGFEYQIREVTRCLDAGQIESPAMSHAFSLTMSRTMDEIRRQIGMKYLME